MVCFRNGEPSRKEFRRYNIKTVTGINDFASMKETVYRRYHRLILEEAPLPQLVIIDGGKGQLNAAMESIRALGLEGKMTLVGLAKNQEEIFFSKDSQSIKLPWNSESLKLIRRIRDEVHNTGIQFHRKKRSASAFKTELEDVKGIGRQTIDILLKEFKSINNIRKASETELTAVIGKAKAGILLQHFDK
jgi:excinuclease ABC subunit C